MTGTLLDGRVRYTQAEDGYRTGIEPVLLAASIPARDGEIVVEAGTGAAAGLLCLAARVPGVLCIGIELDPPTADLARRNAADNRLLSARIVTADITAWAASSPFHHAMANPPWHDEAGTASPDARRDRAKRSRPGLLESWATALGHGLQPRGTLNLILPARSLAAGMAALAAADCRQIVVIPLWPRAGVGAKLVILRGTKLGRGPCQMHPGLVLHDDSGAYTPAATAILRSGAPLT